MGGGGEGGTTLEFTPTWVVAIVYTVIIAIFFAVERCLHRAGKADLRNPEKLDRQANEEEAEQVKADHFTEAGMRRKDFRVSSQLYFPELQKYPQLTAANYVWVLRRPQSAVADENHANRDQDKPDSLLDSKVKVRGDLTHDGFGLITILSSIISRQLALSCSMLAKIHLK
ncbi:hypothetical protein Ancab_003724 [Ancistrocladus abbreviatus]